MGRKKSNCTPEEWAAHLAAQREYMRKRREDPAYVAQLRALHRNWTARNLEKVHADNKRRYHADIEATRAKKRAAAAKPHRRAAKEKYTAEHRAEANARAKAWYANNRSWVLRRMAQREAAQAAARHRRAQLAHHAELLCGWSRTMRAKLLADEIYASVWAIAKLRGDAEDIAQEAVAVLLAGEAATPRAAVDLARRTYYRETRGDIWGGNVLSLDDEIGGRPIGDRIADDAGLI